MENVEKDVQTKEDSLATRIGQVMAQVFIGCIAGCLCAIAIALTVRFIDWIF